MAGKKSTNLVMHAAAAAATGFLVVWHMKMGKNVVYKRFHVGHVQGSKITSASIFPERSTVSQSDIRRNNI